MSELRQNLATKNWFVIATERAKRPGDFKKNKAHRENMVYSEKCPFCPGNEHKTTEPVLEYKKDGKWVVRSVLNKFSAFSPEGGRERHFKGIYRHMNGVGQCEVVIESPLHNDFFTTMSSEHIQMILRAYVCRFNEIMKDDRIEAVMVFKNYGPSAGCSQAHPHSQIIGTPVVPTIMRYQLEAAKRYFDDNGQCAYCQMMKEEIRENERIVTKNDSFVVFCPYASGGAFETWIVPRRHCPNFGDINHIEIEDLSSIMKDLLSRYYYGLDDPDFNYVIKTPPRDESNDRSYHWYIQVLPKLTQMAGFEIGSGMFINVTLPEENAEFLRNVDIKSPLKV